MYQFIGLKEVVNQEDHWFALLPARSEYFIQLIETATAINYIANHFEISKLHI